jgi:hypothetical protein
MEELLKLKSLWEKNLETSIKLKVPLDEKQMILWFIKTIDDAIKELKKT